MISPLLALEENNEIIQTVQLLIFIWGIDSSFRITEELCALQSLKGTTTTESIFVKVCESVENLDLSWGKLKTIPTDGARNMVGNKTGVGARINEEILQLDGTLLHNFTVSSTSKPCVVRFFIGKV